MYTQFLFLAARGLCCCAQTFPSGRARASCCSGFSCRSAQLWSAGSAVVVHRLSCPVASSRTGVQTRVPPTGRRTPNHWTTREVPHDIICKGLKHMWIFVSLGGRCPGINPPWIPRENCFQYHLRLFLTSTRAVKIILDSSKEGYGLTKSGRGEAVTFFFY